MRLKTKLLIPIVSAVFISFSAFIAIEFILRARSDEEKLTYEMARLKDVIASSSVAYLWSYDTEGLTASIESLLKDEFLVEIEISNAEGVVLASASESSEPELIAIEAPIERYGSPLGKARIVFTDYPLRKGTSDYLVTLLALEAAIILFISAMTFITARIVTIPVARLSGKVKGMAEGEADLRSRLSVEGKDEVAELSTHFNEFLDKLASIIASMKKVSRESRGLGEKLSTSAQTVSASSTQISASMVSMAERTAHLREEIVKQRSGVARVDDFAERVVGLIHDQAAAINESAAAVEQLIANVAAIEHSTDEKLALTRSLASLAGELAESMELNVSAMEGTSSSTELISEMIDASRTSLAKQVSSL